MDKQKNGGQCPPYMYGGLLMMGADAPAIGTVLHRWAVPTLHCGAFYRGSIPTDKTAAPSVGWAPPTDYHIAQATPGVNSPLTNP